MTPLRQRESLMAEIAGLRQLLQTTEEDPLASPLMRSRLQELEAKLSKLQTQPSLTPEAEIFFTDGPLELSPTPACADQAGTLVVSPVSTETAGEQLQRMRQRYNAMDREASIYSGLLAALDQAKSDLDERIRAMEKEHDL